MQNQWRVLFLVFIATEHLAILFKQCLMVDIFATQNSLSMRVKLYAWIGDFYRKLSTSYPSLEVLLIAAFFKIFKHCFLRSWLFLTTQTCRDGVDVSPLLINTPSTSFANRYYECDGNEAVLRIVHRTRGSVFQDKEHLFFLYFIF